MKDYYDTTLIITCALQFILALVLFLLPTLIAFGRELPHKWGIFAMNVFGSILFGLGWIIALIWSIWPRGTIPVNVNVVQSVGENIPGRRVCPHCGTIVNDGAFCSKCGGKFKD